jgi:serine/threonine protein kinase
MNFIVDRDLKPENILFKNNVVKITDIGSGKELSVRYMQWKSRPNLLGSRTKIWPFV